MLTPGTVLQQGRYRVQRHIGQGGMGAVYEAYDLRLQNKVALKALLLDEPDVRRAFEREAQRLARLRHPVLPIVIDHFEEGDGQYLVMEYIEGADLAEHLRFQEAPFEFGQVLGWADDLLDALIYLHGLNPPLIHRDIKPQNLKLTPEGRIVLLDFGLATGGLTRVTGVNAISGLQGYTLGFAPPEQMQGGETTERSDIYALGATLYTLLTNQAPLDARVREQAQQHNLPDPQPLAHTVNPVLPSGMSQLLVATMALDPTQRPASARQVRAMLQNVVATAQPGGGVETPRPATPLRVGNKGRGLPTASTALLTLLLTLFCGGGVSLMTLAVLDPQRTGIFMQLPGQSRPTLVNGPSPSPSPPTQSTETSSGEVRLGSPVTARSVDNQNQAVDVTDTFREDEPIIYVVTEVQFIPAGTSVFMRWYQDGEAFEDTQTITADRDYTDTFLEFHIRPTESGALSAGDYSATLFVDGQPLRSVGFKVR